MKNLTFSTLVATSMLTGMASAATYEFEAMNCGLGNLYVLESSNELTIYGMDIEGQTKVNSKNHALRNGIFRCMGWFKIVKGKLSGDGAWKYLDRSGDYLVGSWVPQSHSEAKFTFLRGTGKYSGITGTATDTLVNMSEPRGKQGGGKFHRCSQSKGGFQLPDPKKANRQSRL